ncbi:BON domain-containing protein [Paraburkholderia sp.]|uniref:BON domain-containing protein n=1 Tax=Paraburkholderia sp. TaxID=1926495 RepID=UPI0025F69F90|nr:BON domain-containing protein [Paraburkholderia sp.]
MKANKNKLAQWTAGVLLAAAIGTPGAHAQPQPQGDSGMTASVPAATPAQTRRATRKADRLLAKQVRRALVRVKGLDSSRIVVIARGGDVTLGGSVPEAEQTGVAHAAAAGVSGVRNVTDNLSVKAPGQ